jgi:glycerol uptake facilitator-like aquaporin
MGERVSGGNVAIALLANSVATGFGLAALIYILEPVSGAHFNPAVTLAMAIRRALPWREVAPYLLSQLAAAFAGVVAAHLMFGEPVLSASTHVRAGWAQCWSEFLATFGLLIIISGCASRNAAKQTGGTALAVGGYIAAAYWFTASTSFANPAVTLARAASNTFAGIRPDDATGFIVAEFAGALAATWVWGSLIMPTTRETQP